MIKIYIHIKTHFTFYFIGNKEIFSTINVGRTESAFAPLELSSEIIQNFPRHGGICPLKALSVQNQGVRKKSLEFRITDSALSQ